MTSAPRLDRELTLHMFFRARLAQEFPEADDETLHDTLEGLTDLTDLLAELVRSAQEDEDMAEVLRHRISDMRERAARLAQRAGAKRALVAETMAKGGLARFVQPDITVSLRAAPPALVISDEREIPEGFWKPQPPRLDRQGLLDHLKGGGAVPGACLSNGQPSIAVRTK